MNDADQILKKLLKRNKTPSVQYVVFNKDDIIHKYHSGFADINDKIRVHDRTAYHWFSVTKTFTALAVLQLVERGRFGLDEPVSLYLPELPYTDSITIRQLLAHSAGIPNPNPLSWIHLENEHLSFNSQDFFQSIFKKNKKPRFQPNDKFGYSNLGYVLLGQLISQISGQSYEKYISENILKPIDINPEELGFQLIHKKQMSKGYQKRFSVLNLILGIFIDKSKFMSKVEGKWKPFKNYHVNGSAYGGLIGTVDGMRKYVQELLKPDSLLISNEFKKLLFEENFTNSLQPTGMSLSWFKGNLNGQEYFTHAGGGGGFYCEIRLYPKKEMGTVIIFNRTGMRDERFLDKLDKYHLED